MVRKDRAARGHDDEERLEAAAGNGGLDDTADEETEVPVYVIDVEDDDDGTEEDGAAAAGEPAAGPGGEAERLRRELAEMREQWVRALADLDNYRKRSEREQRELRRFALSDPLRDLLPVVDNLERALAAGGSVDDLKQGIEMILSQVKGFLREHGVREVPAVGAPFDPAIHDAVSREEDPGVDEPTVAQELQRGYTLNDRLLRPALVTVAMPGGERAEGGGG